MSTTEERAITLTILNLSQIFGEKDAAKRLVTIAELWVPSSEVLFVDATGVFKSHRAISDMVDKIMSMSGPDDQFVTLGDVECLKHDEEDDIWVTKVRWGIETPAARELTLTGLDVLTIVGGKIKACYTLLDEKE